MKTYSFKGQLAYSWKLDTEVSQLKKLFSEDRKAHKLSQNYLWNWLQKQNNTISDTWNKSKGRGECFKCHSRNKWFFFFFTFSSSSDCVSTGWLWGLKYWTRSCWVCAGLNWLSRNKQRLQNKALKRNLWVLVVLEREPEGGGESCCVYICKAAGKQQCVRLRLWPNLSSSLLPPTHQSSKTGPSQPHCMLGDTRAQAHTHKYTHCCMLRDKQLNRYTHTRFHSKMQKIEAYSHTNTCTKNRQIKNRHI